VNLLCERFAHRGEFCVHGRVLRDQLSFLQCRDIHEVSPVEGKDPELALSAFQAISESG